MSSTSGCPACAHCGFEELIDFGVLPRSGTFLSKPDQEYEKLQLSFEFCASCALIRQRFVANTPRDYTFVSRTTARRLPVYANEIAASLRREGVGMDDLVVEVGANDGAFLDVLRQSGFRKRLGVEPSIRCAGMCSDKGHLVVNSHLNENNAAAIRGRYGAAGAVVCRHTLEHVPDPLGFLTAIRTLLREDGIVFIEVPDASPITQDLRGHELWDEHLHIFTQANLLLVMQRAGLVVTKAFVSPYHGSLNILVWGTSNLKCEQSRHLPDHSSSSPSDVQYCRDFKPRWTSLCRQVQAELSNCPKPVAVVGASHPQSNYALFTRIGNHVQLMIDDDPAKVGRYVPVPRPVRVVSTDEFLNGTDPGTVIRTAFGYEEWMDRLLAPLATKAVRIVRPYEPRLFFSL